MKYMVLLTDTSKIEVLSEEDVDLGESTLSFDEWEKVDPNAIMKCTAFRNDEMHDAVIL